MSKKKLVPFKLDSDDAISFGKAKNPPNIKRPSDSEDIYSSDDEIYDDYSPSPSTNMKSDNYLSNIFASNKIKELENRLSYLEGELKQLKNKQNNNNFKLTNKTLHNKIPTHRDHFKKPFDLDAESINSDELSKEDILEILIEFKNRNNEDTEKIYNYLKSL